MRGQLRHSVFHPTSVPQCHSFGVPLGGLIHPLWVLRLPLGKVQHFTHEPTEKCQGCFRLGALMAESLQTLLSRMLVPSPWMVAALPLACAFE